MSKQPHVELFIYKSIATNTSYILGKFLPEDKSCDGCPTTTNNIMYFEKKETAKQFIKDFFKILDEYWQGKTTKEEIVSFCDGNMLLLDGLLKN